MSVGTGAYFFLHLPPPYRWVIGGAFLLFALVALLPGPRGGARGPAVLRMAGFTWTREDFCRGWQITGDTGSGKTSSALVTIAEQVYRNVPDVGGLVIDDKGVLHETFSAIMTAKGRQKDLVVLQVRPDGAPADWRPRHCFNLLSDQTIPPNTFAKLIVDTASSMQGGGDKGFFRTNVQLQIGKAIESLRLAGLPCTLKSVYECLTVESELETIIERLCELEGDAEEPAFQLVKHWREAYQGQPPEQLGGVKSSIANYLEYFTTPDIAEIFCPPENTFGFAAIDRGALICVSMPQKYQTERRYVATLLKILYYVHLLRRFDQPKEERRRNNLLVLWADEAQNFVTQTEGISDHSTVDRIREAGGTIVAATQSQSSFYPPLTREKAKVLSLNLRNRCIFKAADEECAKESADFIGKRRIVKRSWGSSGGGASNNMHYEDEYVFKPHELRNLKPFTAVVTHCRLGYHKRLLPPREADGTVCQWFKS